MKDILFRLVKMADIGYVTVLYFLSGFIVARLIDTLAEDNPKIPSNILHALQNVKPSQLMDKRQFDFKGLEQLNEIEFELED
jgi:hypothetical protein